MAILPFENHARNYQIRSIDYILLRYVFIYECDSCRSLQSVCYTVYTITFWVILINNPLLRSDVLVVNEKRRGRRGTVGSLQNWWNIFVKRREHTIIMKLLLQSFLPMPTGLTGLERIIANRAMGVTIINQLTNEISFDRVVFELSNVNFHSTNLWILSVIAIYLYSRLQYFEGIQSKLKDIEVYDRYKRLIREIMFIVFLVFTRDVQNAI